MYKATPRFPHYINRMGPLLHYETVVIVKQRLSWLTRISHLSASRPRTASRYRCCPFRVDPPAPLCGAAGAPSVYRKGSKPKEAANFLSKSRASEKTQFLGPSKR